MHRLTSRRLEAVVPSEIRRVLVKAVGLEKAGRRVIHFEIGRPDFDTPEPIKQAASKALADGQVHYTNSRGIPELRQAIADDANRRLGLAVDPEKNVMVTAGSTNSIIVSLLTLLGPGDEMLVPEPMYLFYLDWGALVGARTVAVPLNPQTGYQLTEEDLEARVTDRTRVILLNSPHNPTGSGLTDDSLAAVARVAQRHDLAVLSDEVYDRLVYPPYKHRSIAALPGMAERTVVVNSFSKPFAMDGWRIGWLLAPGELVDDLENVHHRVVMNVTTFAQYGALEAMRRADELTGPMLEEYTARRELALDIIEASPRLSVHRPEGAFYLWLTINQPKDRPGLDDWQLADLFLDRAGVAITPGVVFGEAGRGRIRVSYAVSRTDLEQGLRAIDRVLREID